MGPVTAEKYQGLFNLMSREHGLNLSITEMDEIIIECQKVVETLNIEDNKPNYERNKHRATS